MNIQLNNQQKEALEKIKGFLFSDFDNFFLLGDAGTGKSYTVSLGLKDSPFRESEIIALAPSHKAKNVLKKFFNGSGFFIEVATIHSALGMRLTTSLDNGKNILKKDEERDLLALKKLVIIDEISMVNEELVKILMPLQVEYGFKLLLLGDIKQLPPINSYQFPIFELQGEKFYLTEVMRYSNENIKKILDDCKELIGINQEKINQENFDFISLNPYPLIKQDEDLIITNYSDALNQFLDTRKKGKDAICLAFKNKTLDQLENEIRLNLYGKDFEKLPRYIPFEILISQNQLYWFDPILKIIQDISLAKPITNGSRLIIKSCEEIFLSDLFIYDFLIPKKYASEKKKQDFKNNLKQFYCLHILDVDNKKEGCIAVSRNAEQLGEYLSSLTRYTNKLDRRERGKFWNHKSNLSKHDSKIRIKEVSSIHKSQGSSFDHVFLFDDFKCSDNRKEVQSNFNFMQPRLWYVGASRAKKSLTIVKS